MYTDEFDAELTMLQALDLIAIGDKYQIENIMEDCLNFMLRKLFWKVSTDGLGPVKEIAVMAEKHHLDDILDKALDRIIDLFPLSQDDDTEDNDDDDAQDEDEDVRFMTISKSLSV